MPPLTFADELSKQKVTYLKEAHAQEKITKAITDGDTGQITRIFDKAIFTPGATTKAYDKAIIASKNSEIETHLTSAVNAASSGMFNTDKTGLSKEFIESIGVDNHMKLVELCIKKNVSIVDLVLQAIANVYCQAVCEKQTSLVANNSKLKDENITDTQNFNSQIATPMNDVIAKIKKDLVFPSILSQIQNYLTSFFKFEDRVTAGSLHSRTKEVRDVIYDTIDALKDQKALLKNGEAINSAELAIKEMTILIDQLDTSLDQLIPSADDYGVPLPQTDGQKNKILTPQEKQKGLATLDEICNALVGTITKHILPIDHLFISDKSNNGNGPIDDLNKNNKGFLKQILDILMGYIYRRKEELPESLENKSNITKNLYSVDPILSAKMKSTFQLSAPPNTVSATAEILNTCKKSETTSETMKEMKTKLHADKEVEVIDEKKTNP